ncbi:MAG TPA: thiamine phosphate synthase [Terriglobales bacterium]|nr:thiamine phosphate synthase [Terriglobales bacterium]
MADRCLLYYITDRAQFAGNDSEQRRALLAKVAEAARAGIDYIQLREKDLCGRELENLAREVVAIVRQNSKSTRILVNARTDIALAAGADGVHLPGGDISVEDVRSIWSASDERSLPSRKGNGIITVSCHVLAEVVRAEAAHSDFAVFAPVFEKSGRTPAGLDALREACRAGIPVLALGGVTLTNAADCLAAGAAGIAAIRLFQENNTEGVVQALRSGRRLLP